MSANKFKVGDKVKVRKGLVADKYYDDVSLIVPWQKWAEEYSQLIV